MRTYQVEVMRVCHQWQTIEVQAKNKAEAKQIALDGAGDLEFRGNNADYTVESIEETTPTVPCQFCDKQEKATLAHRDRDGEWVCDDCWDPRLK